MIEYNNKVEFNNPYVWMAQKAIDGLRAYGTVIVAMQLDGIRYNEILDYNAAVDSWEWVNDWYEGQRDIIFIGAILLADIEVPQ